MGIVYIATGAYIHFWSDFYVSCEKFFCIDIKKHYELFTDIKDCNDVAFPNVHIHEIEDLGWIVNTSNKSKYICNIQQDLKGYDCVFYINSNLVFTSVIYASEIIPQASHNYLTALSFDHYLGIDKYIIPMTETLNVMLLFRLVKVADIIKEDFMEVEQRKC